MAYLNSDCGVHVLDGDKFLFFVEILTLGGEVELCMTQFPLTFPFSTYFLAHFPYFWQN